jgi:hypothetical protein
LDVSHTVGNPPKPTDAHYLTPLDGRVCQLTSPMLTTPGSVILALLSVAVAVCIALSRRRSPPQRYTLSQRLQLNGCDMTKVGNVRRQTSSRMAVTYPSVIICYECTVNSNWNGGGTGRLCPLLFITYIGTVRVQSVAP